MCSTSSSVFARNESVVVVVIVVEEDGVAMKKNKEQKDITSGSQGQITNARNYLKFV